MGVEEEPPQEQLSEDEPYLIQEEKKELLKSHLNHSTVHLPLTV